MNDVSEPSSLAQPSDHLDPLFLRACRGEAVETTPIWIMRQAGRYLPEYRRVRKDVDFLTLCHTPDLATEVTLQPIRRFGLDASILFSDIMVPVEAMGVEVAFNPGPVIQNPVRSEEAIKALGRPDPTNTMGFVLQTVKNLRRELPPSVALIGFAGAPFTMAAYMVEGGASKDFAALKSLMFQDSIAFHALMEKLSLVVGDYLLAQIEAGAQAVQLFDTWAGLLSPTDYKEFVFPHVQSLIKRVKSPGVPFILYGNGTGGLLELMDQTGADVIGLDWRLEIEQALPRLSEGRVVQGNLDPSVLFAPPSIIQDQAARILQQIKPGQGHIFNLGHGISRHTPVEAVETLVTFVHDEGRRLRSSKAAEA
ncbi:MAG: uroporphyrinogen decarboxylase [Candidatus Eisenbacteria bacterium]|uniref:Uroporphyrinogen decarboxylase n=1 Tax=Eiseniibacteriota bacterium TaxID=2212470 RepID=A0A7Y2E6B8_UNCEI|nr:uroporphyrinogen decarboxylase [Candidatus Eisenbacteria bacterium]